LWVRAAVKLQVLHNLGQLANLQEWAGITVSAAAVVGIVTIWRHLLAVLAVAVRAALPSLRVGLARVGKAITVAREQQTALPVAVVLALLAATAQGAQRVALAVLVLMFPLLTAPSVAHLVCLVAAVAVQVAALAVRAVQVVVVLARLVLMAQTAQRTRAAVAVERVQMPPKSVAQAVRALWRSGWWHKWQVKTHTRHGYKTGLYVR
jgi:hypothetical protein